MSSPLRVLHLEDDQSYSSLVQSQLTAEGFAPEMLCVETREAFLAGLESGNHDLIIADYCLPRYNGLEALKLAQQKRPETPILLVSGTIGEEAAIASLKAGATDYVLKHWPERLIPAIRRALREAEERKSRLRAEAALKSSEVRFHSIWEHSVDGMRLTDEHGTIIAVNQAFCALAGMDREELEGRPFTVTQADGHDAESELAAYRKRFQERTVTLREEREMIFRTGKAVDLERSEALVESHGQRTMLLSLFRDVTERKHLEEQLRHSQKMEAIGRLAGGVAHDFNNILTVIQGHASLLQSSGTVPEAMAGSMEQISRAADRAASLTRQLLTFSRRQLMQPKQLDLNAVLNNTTRMLGRILGEDIALEFNYSPTVPLVLADEGMMEQTLLNLAVNSRDAMPAGGRLIIAISIVDMDAQAMHHHPERLAGRFACLRVRDTGCGVEPDALPHIFEPFFTTKAVGKGTGLGLATVYGIIKQHRGWIEVESPPGHGTTFDLFLPCAAESVPASTEPAIEAPPPGGTETILVVEDELPVREVVSKVLTGTGYRVLQATNGLEALATWAQNKEKIDLLLTDIVMPDGLNGRDLAEKLQAEKSGLRVIFTSGYSANIVGKDFTVQDGLNFLQKPYPPKKLLRLIRQCLDAS